MGEAGQGELLSTQNPLPETKPASLHLKLDSWNTIVSFWDGLFSVAKC